MSGLGGLNKSPEGVVIALVQLQLPTVATKSDLEGQTRKICDMVEKARKNMPTIDLVVFPEYSLHGLSMDTNPEIMCRPRWTRGQSVQRGVPQEPHLGLFLHHGTQLGGPSI